MTAKKALVLSAEHYERLSIDAPVVFPEGNIGAVVGDHADAPNGIQVVQNDVLRRTSRVFHPDNPRLALPGSTIRTTAAGRVVVVEKAVQTRPVHQNVAAIDDAESPCHLAWRSDLLIRDGTVQGEIGVVQCVVPSVERVRCGRVRLIVGCFCLHVAKPDVLCAVQLVLVKGPMLDRRRNGPNRACFRLDQIASTAVH